MQTQIEAKFLNVNHEQIRQRLEELKATRITPMQLVRRAVMDYPNGRLQQEQDGWVQLKTTGKVTTLIYKEVAEQRKGGTKYIETKVHSFEQTIELFERIGLKVQSLQESRQEVWHVGTVRISVDKWPWVHPFLRIEGPSESAIRDIAARLGFPWAQAVFGNTTLVYASEYPGINLDRRETIHHIANVKFGSPLPRWLKDRQI